MRKTAFTGKKENVSTPGGPNASGAARGDTSQEIDLDTLWQDILKDAAKALEKQVPEVPKSSIPDEKNESKRIIEQANDNAINAQSSMLALISQSEKARLKKQTPVLISVLALAALQLIAFNALIGYVLHFAIRNPESGNFPIILEFLKYYIGAVLVEMIGMIVFITKSTFTSATKEMLQIVKFLSGKDKSDEK